MDVSVVFDIIKIMVNITTKVINMVIKLFLMYMLNNCFVCIMYPHTIATGNAPTIAANAGFFSVLDR